jgi:hypothetical protein
MVGTGVNGSVGQPVGVEVAGVEDSVHASRLTSTAAKPNPLRCLPVFSNMQLLFIVQARL